MVAHIIPRSMTVTDIYLSTKGSFENDKSQRKKKLAVVVAETGFLGGKTKLQVPK